MERLVVERTFAGDHQVAGGDFSLKAEQRSDRFETRLERGAAEAEQAKPESAGRTGARRVAKIAMEVAGDDVGQMAEMSVERLGQGRRGTFLWGKSL